MKGSKGKLSDILRARETIHIRLLGGLFFFFFNCFKLRLKQSQMLLFCGKKTHNVLIN